MSDYGRTAVGPIDTSALTELQRAKRQCVAANRPTSRSIGTLLASINNGKIALVLTIFQQHGGRDVMKKVIGPSILTAGAA
jgi:hypothetical protein